MNRELKFRAIMQGTESWVCGYPHSVYGNGIDSIQDIKTYKIEYIRIDTLGQYTGLKDENDKEIYEGDILKNVEIVDYDYPAELIGEIPIDEELKYKVVFNMANAQFIGTRNSTPLKPVYFKWSEVIGNIYENPELLK